jgi:peptide-methionine (R)-S-oxide reductase
MEPEQVAKAEKVEKVEKSDAEWRAELTPEQYRIMRQKGTEPAFSGALNHNHADGSYSCAACGAHLFDSDTKFDSGSGWPSFWVPATTAAVTTHEDRSYGMRRTEVMCARCGAHLGHIFPDGPKPTGLRYCIHSVSLDFQPAKESDPR